MEVLVDTSTSPHFSNRLPLTGVETYTNNISQVSHEHIRMRVESNGDRVCSLHMNISEMNNNMTTVMYLS